MGHAKLGTIYIMTLITIELNYQFHVFEMLLDEPPLVYVEQQG